MDKIQRFFNPEEEQPKEQSTIIPEIPSLSWDTRLKGFGICLLIAVLLGVGAVILYFINGDITGFAILYTCAVILGVISTMFLMGPLNQLKKMFDSTRWIATIVFLASIVLTIVSAVVIKIGILVLLFIIIQFLALGWYTISYIPFARDAVKSCCGGIMGIKKSPLISLPFLKKRLRSITALGLHNLTVNEFNFTVHFTLHRNENTIAFYKSESVENQRSPEWFHLKFPTTTQCLQNFLMRVWIISSENCRLFLEYNIHLDGLFIPDEQKDNSQRSNNSLWLEMFGYQFTDNDAILENQKLSQPKDTMLTQSERKSKRINFVKSYNKLSILRMINLIDAIRAENRSAARYLERLQLFMDIHQDYLSKIKERESRQLRIACLKQHFDCQFLIYEQRLNSNEQRQNMIRERKNRLEENVRQLVRQQSIVECYKDHLNQSICALHDLTQVIVFRQKDIIHEIYNSIYPITDTNNDEYSIANITLPQAEDKIYQTSLTRERANEIEAAVGYCAHLVCIISRFMQIPLRFPIEYHGTSPIKIYDYSLQSNEFVLQPNVNMGNFLFGLYLLNRNIGQLMNHCRVGTRPIDYRKTLKNLKGLLEQYFTNTNKNQIQLYDLNQSSIEASIPANVHMSQRRTIIQKQNSSSSSLLSLPDSTASSLIESLDLNRNDGDSDVIRVYSKINIISPRLTMQLSQQE